MVFVFLHLTSFTSYNVFQVHACCCRWQSFVLLWLSSSLCVCYIYNIYIFFIHSSCDGCLGRSHVSAIVHSTAMDTGGVYIFWNWCVCLPRRVPRSGTAGPSGSSTVKFFEKPAYCLPQCCASLCSHQQGMRVPFSPHLCQHM